jgi:hypothetical protein
LMEDLIRERGQEIRTKEIEIHRIDEVRVEKERELVFLSQKIDAKKKQIDNHVEKE